MPGRLHKIRRILLLAPAERAYLRQIRASGLFDRQFYIGTNPRMHPLHRRFPERHFILHGEAAGLYPNPDFSPHAYLMHNDDVAALALRPFQHFITTGRSEVRVTKPLPQMDPAFDLPTPVLRSEVAPRADHAVVAHVFYHEMWDEFETVLRAVDFAFDLFVTITFKGEDSDALKLRIQTAFPEARVILLRNHGRDIFPFLFLVNAGWLDGYAAVCKIHTKKSPHRADGDLWRTHLIRGVLPPQGAAELLSRFKADPEAGFWVADGQHYDDPQWWGSNFDRVAQVLHRVELAPDRARLSFPAGSIYWLKPVVIDMLRGLRLSEEMFDPERSQTDGTLAHAVERVMGLLAEAAGLKIRQTTHLVARRAPVVPPVRPGYVSAFYLPQFHPVPENDGWWGTGYTEWTGVTRATPQFNGHVQPMLPADLGFYDLRVTETMGRQAALAAASGIDGFCVYHYWFDGRRILEAPIDRLLARADIAFPFYLCWANESWRRNWDGLSGEVLLPQSYADGWEDALAASLVPYFADARYQRPDGSRPRFVIYRPEDMPDPAGSVARLRTAWSRLGVGAVELGAVLFHVEGESPVAEDLFDFWVEMPPHGMVQEDDYLFGGPAGNRMPAPVLGGFEGLIYDYARLADRSTERAYLRTLPRSTIAGIMPSWDNTARRGRRAHIAWGANPARFDRWLRRLLAQRLRGSYREEMFINAWNEWAEKAMMEPSDQYRQACLAVLARQIGPRAHTAAAQEITRVSRAQGA